MIIYFRRTPLDVLLSGLSPRDLLAQPRPESVNVHTLGTEFNLGLFDGQRIHRVEVQNSMGDVKSGMLVKKTLP
jgi:hypothetical protein